MNYEQFIESKKFNQINAGFDANDLNPNLKPHQDAIVKWALKRGRAAIFADTGLGKQHPIDEPVLTPQGWIEIGDLKVGDYVIGSNGRKTKVTGVYPQGEREIVKVTFNDGTHSLVGWEHLWAVRTKTMKYRRQGYQVMNTREIASSIHRDWQVPVCNPVEYDRSDSILIHPYVLGVLLGDGSMTHGCPSVTTDEWIIDRISNDLGYKGKREIHESDGIGFFRFHGMIDICKELNIHGKGSHEKHIPDEYIFSTIENRLAILRGLLDTDGSPMEDGGIEYCTTSKMLMNGVCELVRGLGGIARNVTARRTKLNGREMRVSWRVNIKMPNGINPFMLPRKADRYVEPTKYPVNKIIRSVESCGYEQEAVCISVDAEDSLYITRDYIVTHNTVMQLEWASQVSHHTQKPVILFAPLAVGKQTEEEAAKFEIASKAKYMRQFDSVHSIVITNYEMIDNFNPNDFAGIVLDESSILKGQSGAYRKKLTDFASNIEYRLSCTATPSPNDFMELGTQCEFLGVMSQVEMLAMFFTHDGSETQKWRLKGHAQAKFWEWLATWAVVISNPADLGFDGTEYELPPLNIHKVILESDQADTLLPEVAQGLSATREAKKRSMTRRVKACAELVNQHDEPFLVWGEFNAETDALAQMINGAVQVKGADKIETKEDRLLGFSHGKYKKLVSKSSICGYGMNWQHACKMAFVGPTYSFEQFYQAVRREWRFGQTKPVDVWVFMTEEEVGVHETMMRKMEQDQLMRREMIKVMSTAMNREVSGAKAIKTDYQPTQTATLPSFL